MGFEWKKKGLVFEPANRFEWMSAYAQVPTVLELDDRLRIFFTCRPLPDKNGQSVSYISFIDVENKDPQNILYVHNKPSLPLGDKGSFDEFGTHPCHLLRHNDRLYFYYQGWTRNVSVPYSTALGLAFSDDDGKTFSKLSKGPLFSRNYLDPYLENGFYIYKEEGSFYLFYASCKEWIDQGGKLEPVYKIVRATSSDGINWEREGKELFEPKFEMEASGRPCVIKIDGTYHMWFCYRDVNNFRGNVNGAYRIGYATSHNLENWIRDDDKAGIDVSEEGWDSEMIAYPFVCKVLDKYWMFYNGNHFGKYGFGYAELNF